MIAIKSVNLFLQEGCMGALHMSRAFFHGLFCCCIIGAGAIFGQTVTISPGTGRLFEGVGSVSGGGATSVLLKDYAEPYRSQILDFLFKPKFGASMNTLFFEIGGDCNSTQGSELSHMHTANDLNCQRGYEWWLIKQAKTRNPSLTTDGVAWGCPGWVGGGNFWSTDMQNYYVKWIQGLKSTYGIDLDAIGCRNESGTNYTFPVQFKALLKSNNLNTKLHGFDNWGAGKWDFVNQFSSNTALANAIDALSAHTTNDGSQAVPAAAINTNKPIWDTEEHAYYAGYTCEQAIAHDVCANYVSNSKVTKTLFWYLIEAYYSVEQFTNQTSSVANQPWSGHYQINPGLWGYAHFNQFADLTWSFIDNACGKVTGGGTYVTLKSPDNSDFSVIIETQNGSGGTLNFTISGGLPTTKPLCVWMSNSSNQFVKQADITPTNGSFSITVAGNSIYSISTTTGQQKGSYSNNPASQAFPVPYYENYDHYTDPKLWGYLPYYQCDICGAWEIANSPTGTGKCLRQVLSQKANSWAPEWAPFTLIGNTAGTNYEVSADVYFDGSGGWAGVMGRVNQTGTYGCYPRGYYFHLASNGAWGLYYANAASGDGTSLATGTATLTGTGWHNVKLQMSGSTLTGFIENKQVCNVTNSQSGNGVAGLCAGSASPTSPASTNPPRNTACFDNLIINTVNGATPTPTDFSTHDANPPYSFSTQPRSLVEPLHERITTALTSYKAFGNHFVIPKEFAGKNIAATVYDLKGKLVKKTIIKTSSIDLGTNFNRPNEVFIVKLKVLE
jgi:galactosylceramidase